LTKPGRAAAASTTSGAERSRAARGLGEQERGVGRRFAVGRVARRLDLDGIERQAGRQGAVGDQPLEGRADQVGERIEGVHLVSRLVSKSRACSSIA
jgi:hypothetical protein